LGEDDKNPKFRMILRYTKNTAVYLPHPVNIRGTK
jgi:hypothetical protein